MTASIVRRFAKYHQVLSLADRSDEEICGGDFLLVLSEWVYGALQFTRLIQALTRIECAEFAFDEAQAWDPQGVRRLALVQLGEDLLRRAGIDPEKWRDVTE